MPPVSTPHGATTPRLQEPPRARPAVRPRCASRAFLPEPLPLLQVAHLLAAASDFCPRPWRRAAAGARRRSGIGLYAVTAEGTWRHDPRSYEFEPVSRHDLRAATGAHGAVLAAPLHLVYVSDFDVLRRAQDAGHGLPAADDVSAVVEGIHRECAALGLRDLVRGPLDRSALARALDLRVTQYIVLVQTVGRPAPEAE